MGAKETKTNSCHLFFLSQVFFALEKDRSSISIITTLLVFFLSVFSRTPLPVLLLFKEYPEWRHDFLDIFSGLP